MGREEEPERLTRVAGGELEADDRPELADAASDLEQAEAQGVELHTGRARRDEPATERVQQPVGRGVEEQAELVGEEAVAAHAVREAGILEVLDPQLRLPAVHIPV